MGVLRRIEHLEDWEKRLKSLHRPYKKILYGSSTALVYGNNKIQFVGKLGDERLEGFHIIGNFKKHLIKEIDNLTYNMKLKDTDLFYSWYHHENIIKNLESEIGIMDINSCYYDTANLLGYVTPKQYESAYKKPKEYKKARNIAIGCLSMNKTVFEVDENGEIKIADPILADERMKAIRRTIIDFVGQFTLAVYNQFPEDVFMMVTDCFYYNRRIEKDLREFITSHGYTVKNVIGDFFELKEKNTGIEAYIYDYKDCRIKPYKMSKGQEVNVYLKKAQKLNSHG